MKESFLQFLWQYGLFNTQDLRTTEGIPLQIENRGWLNRNSGPDFQNARIRIGEQSWAGQVEIHTYSSEWLKHGHQHDAAYDNTVLHVVFQNDIEIRRRDGTTIPCLVLNTRIPAGYLRRWRELDENLSGLACAGRFQQVGEDAKLTMRHRALAERIIGKAHAIQHIASDTICHWDEILHRLIARYLGFKVNSDAMEQLATITPLKLLRHYAGNQRHLEALLFGQAGLLSGGHRDKYMKELFQEYNFIAAKHGLIPLNPVIWKFSRLRPSNFPTLRIAQLAALLHRRTDFFDELLRARHIAELKMLFYCRASAYWDNRFSFGQRGSKQSKNLGTESIHGLLVNAVIPVMVAYANHRGDCDLKERAIDFLNELPAENNLITRFWNKMGMPNACAYDSQALIGLKLLYCDKKRCLECSIGQQLLQTEEKLPVAECLSLG
jgi:hypothetical protein